MSLTTAFVAAYALICVCVSGLAVFRVWKAEGLAYKALWILGSLLGFVGFSVDPTTGGDLILQFGVQIPVVIGLWSSINGLALKALFPIVAVVALIKVGETRAELKDNDM